jgi:hypothetical protein
MSDTEPDYGDPRIDQAEDEKEYGRPRDRAWFEDDPRNPNVPRW